MTLFDRNVAWACESIITYMMQGREDRAYKLAVELAHYAKVARLFNLNAR